MRRPGWLGGERAEGDAAKPGDDAGDDAAGGKDEPKPKTAAERSARRVAAKRPGEAGSSSSRAARRRLADRVGKASGSGQGGQDGKNGKDGKADAEKPVRPAAKRPRRDEPKADEPKAKPEKAEAPGKQKSGTGKAEKSEKAAGKAARKGRTAGEKGRIHRGEEKRRDRRRRKAKRPSAGKRVGAGLAAFAAALKRGGTETRKWAVENGPKAGRLLLAGLAAVFALFFAVVGFVLTVLIAVGRIVARPLGRILRALDRAARAASRLLTPARALTLVVAGAAILLALSQYADYRSISIGNGAYADVKTLAPAPETGRLQAGDPHSYVFVPVAIACLLLLAVATVGGRWRACRLITVAGVAAIVVALLVDRPAGLDPGDVAVSFEGVRATLIGGFYAQIAAGILLIGSSSLLARRLRLATSPRRAPVREREGAAKRPARRSAAGAGTARA